MLGDRGRAAGPPGWGPHLEDSGVKGLSFFGADEGEKLGVDVGVQGGGQTSLEWSGC